MLNVEKSGLHRLNENERNFATENYHLIYRFMKANGLDPEKYFDLIVFDYLLAVQKYLSNEDLREKHNFESVAYTYMKSAIKHHYRNRQRKCRKNEKAWTLPLRIWKWSNISKGKSRMEWKKCCIRNF